MKRHGYLYEQVYSYENLVKAAYNAKQNKGKQKTVKAFFKDFEANIRQLQHELETFTYVTSPYSKFVKYEPKKREIYRLPFRDRVVHWAIMQVIETIWVSTFTRDSFACIKGRGIHPLLHKLKKDLRSDLEGTAYCLKIDVQKFYPNIDHSLLKQVIRKKIKDPKLLQLLDSIIASVGENEGVPIGNYLSQFLANLYLSELDHVLKEGYGVRYYYRYADDLVLLGSSKDELRSILVAINHYLISERQMMIKNNYQIFPVASRGIDFVGYVTYHTHVRVRKRIKQNLCRQLAELRKKGLPEEEIRKKISSRVGFVQHSDSKHLFKTLNIIRMAEKKFTRAEYDVRPLIMDGTKMPTEQLVDKNIRLLNFLKEPSLYDEFRLKIHFELEEEVTQPDGEKKKEWVRHITFNSSTILASQLQEIVRKDREKGQEPFPMLCKIKQQKTNKGGREGFYYYLDEPDE